GNDLLKGNRDLIARAARILMSKPIYSLSVKPFRRKTGTRGLVIRAESKIPQRQEARNIAYVEIYVDDRHFKTLDAENGSINRVSVSLGTRQRAEVVVEAFDRDKNLPPQPLRADESP